MIKIGFDIHGVLDKFPVIFKEMTRNLSAHGVEIHVITGQEEALVVPELEAIGIHYDRFFSVVGYHKQIGTKMWLGPKGTWFCDSNLWDATKGDYCFREGIDIHFDDTLKYGEYMPKTTTFIHVAKFGFENFYKYFKVI